MRVFQAQYGLLTNGERYLFFCANPEEDESSEVMVLDCALSDLSNQRTILAAYGRDAIVGERTSLEMLTEAAREAEADQQQSESRPLSKEKKSGSRRSNLIADLDTEEGVSIKTVYQQTKPELYMSHSQTDVIVESLRNRGEMYSAAEVGFG